MGIATVQVQVISQTMSVFTLPTTNTMEKPGITLFNLLTIDAQSRQRQYLKVSYISNLFSFQQFSFTCQIEQSNNSQPGNSSPIFMTNVRKYDMPTLFGQKYLSSFFGQTYLLKPFCLIYVHSTSSLSIICKQTILLRYQNNIGAPKLATTSGYQKGKKKTILLLSK